MIPGLRRFLRRCTTLFRASRADADLQRELAAHAALLEDEYRRRGWSAADARREARLRLGSAAAVRDRHRDARTFAWLADGQRDAIYALRLLRRSPGLAATVAASLAIGIGGNVAVFTVANALLFRPPAGIVEPERLIDIGAGQNGGGFAATSYPMYREIERRATTLTAINARAKFPRALALSIPGSASSPTRVFGHIVSANYFASLGITPAAGTWFEADERAATVVVSSRFGRTWFGSASPIGRLIHLNGAPFSISSVVPDRFHGSSMVGADLWLPLLAAPAARLVDPRAYDERRSGWLIVGGRLKPDLPLAAANAELAAIASDLQREYQANGAQLTLAAAPSSLLPGNRDIATVLLGILTALMALVLLVACTNVTGVLFARAEARRHEMAVRLSIGAGRARLVRQLLLETVLLFAVGSVAGLIMARVMIRGLIALLPVIPVPIAVDLPLDLRVVAFTIGLTSIAALASGLMPALRAAKSAPALALKSESAGGSARWRLRGVFVAGQSAVSAALVFTAVLFTRALFVAGSLDPGYDVRGVEIVTVDLSIGASGAQARLPFWRTLLARAEQHPAIESAALARALPGGFETMGIAIGRPGAQVWNELESFEPDGNIVTRGYFKTMGIPIVAGRDFNAGDVGGGTPVVIVGEAAARHYWPGQTAIGQYLEETTSTGKLMRLVVGVARDVRSSSVIDGVAQSTVYVPLEQEQSWLTNTMTVVARGAGGRPIAGDIRSIVTSLNPGVPIDTTGTLRESMALGLLPQRIVASIAASLGLACAILAAIGIYGLSSFAVSRRTREFGIRMALGATRASILGGVLRQGAVLTAIGAAIGLAAGSGIGQILSGFLFGIPADDPLVLVATAVVFTAIGAIACYGPARRATEVDPLAALRGE